MDHRGKRYLTVSLFISHARNLKVWHLSRKELEFYEKHCLLLPVARTHMPAEYAKSHAKRRYNAPISDQDDMEAPAEWVRLKQWWHKDGIHNFDRERDNSLLVVPDCTTYRPWDADTVSVTTTDGHDLKASTVERYYAAWQIHIVESLRRNGYYKRAPFVRELPKSHIYRQIYQLPDNTDNIRTLNGMAAGYDALTLYIFAANEAYHEKFTNIPSGQRLSKSEAAELHQLLVWRAQRALSTSGVDKPLFFEFVHKLTMLIQEYHRHERISLAESAEDDLWDAIELADYGFDYNWEEFLNAAHSYIDKNLATALRRLNPVESTAQEPQENLEHILSDGIGASIPRTYDLQNTAEEIVEFCRQNDLYEVLIGLRNYTYSLTDQRRERYPGFFHRRLRPLALAAEQFTRGILDTAQQPHHGKPFGKLLKMVGTDTLWLEQFSLLMKQGETSDKPPQFLDQKALKLVQSIPDKQYNNEVIAKTLVAAVAARNLVSHRHKLLTYEVTTNLGGACANSIVLVWLFAKDRGYI